MFVRRSFADLKVRTYNTENPYRKSRYRRTDSIGINNIIQNVLDGAAERGAERQGKPLRAARHSEPKSGVVVVVVVVVVAVGRSVE